MTKIRCVKCGRKLLTYDNTSFRRYKSPIKACPGCGEMYVDPRCHEIALEGLPADTFSVKSYVFLVLFGIFLLYRGIHISTLRQLGVCDTMQWLLPAALLLAGVICVVGGLYEIIAIRTGRKRKKFQRLGMESAQRLSDKSYAQQLKALGVDVPEKYL